MRAKVREFWSHRAGMIVAWQFTARIGAHEDPSRRVRCEGTTAGSRLADALPWPNEKSLSNIARSNRSYRSLRDGSLRAVSRAVNCQATITWSLRDRISGDLSTKSTPHQRSVLEQWSAGVTCSRRIVPARSINSAESRKPKTGSKCNPSLHHSTTPFDALSPPRPRLKNSRRHGAHGGNCHWRCDSSLPFEIQTRTQYLP